MFQLATTAETRQTGLGWVGPRRPAIVALAVAAATFALSGCSSKPPRHTKPMGALPSAVTSAEPEWLTFTVQAGRIVPGDPREQRLQQLRQLTFDGTAGSARWHPDGRHVVYESGRSATSCGQLRRLELGTGKSEQLSPVNGRATVGAFMSSGANILFAFSKANQPPCSPLFNGLRWTLPQSDIHALPFPRLHGSANAAIQPLPRPLIEGPAYDAEVDASADGLRVVFTSMRDGDPDLYVASADGSDARRITTATGYDGGARFSPDGTKLVWQAERLTEDAVEAYQEQLAEGTVTPRSLKILLSGSDGQHPRVIVRQGNYNITPSFLPDSRRVLYASDYDDPGSRPGHARNFELYLTDPEGPATATGEPRMERVTFHDGFDGDGHLSPDGRYLLFTSSRMTTQPGGTDLFLARWKDDAQFR